MERAWWIYGVVSSDISEETYESLDGILGAPVESLGSGPLRLITSPLDRALAARLTEADEQMLAEAACSYDAVLTAIVRSTGVVPVRFATVLPDENAAQELLNQQEGRFLDTLRQIRGAHEWVLTIFEALTEEPVENEFQNMTPGHAFFARRQAESDALIRARERVQASARALHSCLEPLVQSSVPLDPGARGELERMAYLVQAEDTARFLSEVRATDVEIKMSGPLPPYHFVERCS